MELLESSTELDDSADVEAEGVFGLRCDLLSYQVRSGDVNHDYP